MARKVWIEVALNGFWGRDLQPNVPVTVDEVIADGIACIRAGAAIQFKPSPVPQYLVRARAASSIVKHPG